MMDMEAIVAVFYIIRFLYKVARYIGACIVLTLGRYVRISLSKTTRVRENLFFLGHIYFFAIRDIVDAVGSVFEAVATDTFLTTD